MGIDGGQELQSFPCGKGVVDYRSKAATACLTISVLGVQFFQASIKIN